MILEKINKILLLGLVATILLGSSSYSFAYNSKAKKKSATSQVAKKKTPASKTTAKKKATVKKKAPAKKKTSVKKKSTSKAKSSRKTSKSSKKKASRRKSTAVRRTRTPSRETVKKDTTKIINPDDMPALEDDSEELPGDSLQVKVSDLISKYVTSNQYATPSDSVNVREKVIMQIIKFLDTPYKFGGNTSKGIDCSAFTRTIYNNTFSMTLPRTAREQYQLGQEINTRSELKFGDLIFFNTRRRVKPGHVAIYIGDNLFAHSSSKYGVMVSSLEQDFYSQRFMGGRRMDVNLAR